MDPNAALAEALDIARAHQAELDDESANHHADTGRLADLVVGLHEFLSTGGFFPAAWTASRVPTPEQRDRGYHR
ncbi:HNH endonuclease [Mycobacterium phage Bane1]|uniref:Uncharacterized protein n=3 Tax=Coopervirus TaxID=1982898 RepID=A0A7U0J755_9CAUD|nr:HNH endonuclease [Mycobacterium phage Bane1]AGU92108.1 HNH endonuclease [Mycobacterium phage Bane1]AGU92194.1 HNH endonuclease [Mycobacterium phage Bane2]QQV92980.1 hypothetical protein SEA_HYDRO_87 [Mycobacterium phage Hydro]